MSKSHTPGPWSHRAVHRHGELIDDYIETPTGMVATVHRPEDAPVIAAAPDMLAALQFYVAICGNTAATVDRQSAQEAYAKARAIFDRLTP